MRSVLVAAVCVLTTTASAEPLPSGAIGVATGAVAGTGADAKRVGAGYYQFGAQASWQPSTTEKRWSWSLRWATYFGAMYGGTASHIESALHTIEMDVLLGVRLRPWSTPSRWLTFRGGGELLRANEPIPIPDATMGRRSFYGAVGSVGLDWYLGGFLLNIDVRYGMIGGSGPADLALITGIAFTGP